jgi:hypothetical protein
MAIHSLSQYLSLAETLAALGVPRDNFRRAIEEGAVSLHGYIRSGPQPFLADLLSGLFHEPDKDKMNGEVAGYLNCDKTHGGAQLIADLLDTRKDGMEWNKRHNLRSKLYLLKPWEGRFIAFRDAPLWGDWQSANGIQGTECVIHPEQLGDDDVSIVGVLLDHIQPVGPSDPDFPHFVLSGMVRLTPATLFRWAHAGRFVSPVRVTPLSWWNEESALVPWSDVGTPKNYFALRYPTTEGFTDTPPSNLSFVPTTGWHDTPTDDDLLFRREDVEAIQNRMRSTVASGLDNAAGLIETAVHNGHVNPGRTETEKNNQKNRRRDAIAIVIDEVVAELKGSGKRVTTSTVWDALHKLAKSDDRIDIATNNAGIVWTRNNQKQATLTQSKLDDRLRNACHI